MKPVLIPLLLLSTLAQAQNPATPAEQKLLNATNHERLQRGLQPLAWDESLAQAADAHTKLVADYRQLSHQYSGEPDLALRAAQAGAHFSAVAENIALGPSVDSLQRQWMNSPAHRANILDPNLNAVGFALVADRGVLYATADFAHIVPSLTPEQAEQAVIRQLRNAGTPATATEEARQTCELPHGHASTEPPRFLMRWQSSNPAELPPALTRELDSHAYQHATVGACAPTHPERGFTDYRIAVLLY